ncbi:MAG: dienelactone hydrolase family protein [Halanaerobiales bacterium]|nr:dienelactone hydrolase family protein [Halanaerobiales bacterium]
MTYPTQKIENDFVLEKKVYIKEIPCLRFLPLDNKKKYPTVVFYHGWSSNKEYQRFKANILATYGYQVIVPDAIFHWEREAVHHQEDGTLEKYFLETVYRSIQEAPVILDYIKKLKKTDKSRVSIMGTSMGGFISSGIFTEYDFYKSLIVFNGSCAWSTLELLSDHKSAKFNSDKKEKLKRYDPELNIDKLKNRPILLLR